MNFDEMKQALDQAEQTLRIADRMAERMADMLRGRLRKCDPYTLRALKRELDGFNAQTRQWK